MFGLGVVCSRHPSKYLKAVWPVFLGCVFEVRPAPWARESLQKCWGRRPPHFGRFFRAPGAGQTAKTYRPETSVSAVYHAVRTFSFEPLAPATACVSEVEWNVEAIINRSRNKSSGSLVTIPESRVHSGTGCARVYTSLGRRLSWVSSRTFPICENVERSGAFPAPSLWAGFREGYSRWPPKIVDVRPDRNHSLTKFCLKGSYFVT